MTNKEIKQILSSHNVKSNKSGVAMIQEHCRKLVNNMGKRLNSRNVKVLRADNFEFALPNPFQNIIHDEEGEK